jgi:hypothetical protein
VREIRQSGSEGGEPHPNAASLPLSCGVARARYGPTERIGIPLHGHGAMDLLAPLCHPRERD